MVITKANIGWLLLHCELLRKNRKSSSIFAEIFNIMPREFQFQVSPEVAANESLLAQHVAKLFQVSPKEIQKVLTADPFLNLAKEVK